MCISPLAPAWATILVLFLLVTIIITIGTTSANNNKFVSFGSDKSLTLKDGRAKWRLHSKKRAEIDGYETNLPPNVKNVQNKHFLSNAFPSSKSRFVIDNSGRGRRKYGRQIEEQLTTMRKFLYYSNVNDDIFSDSGAGKLKRAKGNDKFEDKNSRAYGIFKSPDFVDMEFNFKKSSLQGTRTNNIIKKNNTDEYFAYGNISEVISPKDARFTQGDFDNKADLSQFSNHQSQNIAGFVNAEHPGSKLLHEHPGTPTETRGNGSNPGEVQPSAVRGKRRAVSTTLAATNNRNTRAREEGDVIIGALFPLHRAPNQKTAYARQCGEIWEHYGIHRVEVFIMTLEKINR